MILLVDNYDSFTFNLFQYLAELGAEVVVRRNDTIDLDRFEAEFPQVRGIVISPGPCTPREAGVSVPLIQRCTGRVPILGVCLGHQAIGAAFGAEIVRAPAIMHGKVSEIHHQQQGVFAGVSSPLTATRYHSLVIAPESVPPMLEVTATTADGVIMGVRHREADVEGVQFHPESILTPDGKQLLANFLARTGTTTRIGADPAPVGY